MDAIEQVVVYADVRNAELLEQLTAAVIALCKNYTIHPPPASDTADPLLFLHLWEKERDNVWEHVNNNVPIMRRLECFVTDSKNQADGVVAYALYYRQMPVLSLAAVVTGATEEEAEVSEDWITTALYFTATGLGCSSPSEALTVFFTFPKSAGKVVALEGECGVLVAEQSRLLRDCIRHEWGLPVQLVGASGCDLLGVDVFGRELTRAEEEVEPSVYASLIDELLRNPELCTLRDADPQLHGVLCALNRHHNLRLLRYRLQRGIHVILCRPLSFVLEGLFRGGKSQATQPSSALSGVVASIQNFEHHWLGLPRAEVILIRERDDAAVTTTTAAGASLKWAQSLWGGGQIPTLDALSGWHAVTMAGGLGEGGQLMNRLDDAVREAVASVIAPTGVGQTPTVEGK
ncbi:hypothetical protein TraAM80_04121 [Trypanosoma rangeli]|uniref:Uncharacterized protein n=1 Tax=Trypanosoma rangeli TaxID=5698 RepID=A0A3R7LZ67_TRYRA|nr:uncharacterized protein TraAM80_04121 [Trypanosoma rangeli]RNF06142.1 hypothetical protein TraAM80_04121 [Trypanosoma rangeli]|eukprot:RNF06142.1 hypothetical protein TraAM80_04121 [Trypanosoma rangeli]